PPPPTATGPRGGRPPGPAVPGTPRRTGRRPAANPPPPSPFADSGCRAAPIRRVPRRTAAHHSVAIAKGSDTMRKHIWRAAAAVAGAVALASAAVAQVPTPMPPTAVAPLAPTPAQAVTPAPAPTVVPAPAGPVAGGPAVVA